MADVVITNAGYFIIHDGLDIVVSIPKANQVNNVHIPESLSKAIYKTLTSFDVALNMAKNYYTKPANQDFVINDESTDLDKKNTAVLHLCKSARMESTTLFVTDANGGYTLPGEVVVALLQIMEQAGADADPTYKEYTRIKFTIDVPSTLVMEDHVIYVLTNAYKEFPVGTTFMVMREEDKTYRCIYDTKTALLHPIAYGDPENAESYPYTPDNMEEVTGSVGKDDIPTAEVVNSTLSETMTIAAAETVNIVNCNGEDACIKVTIP